ncbi:hypothetical protein RHMOL_Rhmol10G0261400 [Rhododendron molle]|uniref:Uncharacterized protein n=1 Tax=Rhododendron molle TaxID=49168 RepID=A0ACC0M7E8_RHOML|nr:hypothetical protein RHMOL_Rhmol10G0261400 [Rhododendron molle]
MKPPYLLPTAPLLLLLLSLLPPTTPDLSSDRSSLLLLRSALGGRALLWNISNPTPCLWTGVTCSNSSSSGGVTALRLPGMGLSGPLPQHAFQNLTQLVTLSLRYNALSGPLPPSLFSSLSSLRNLYLQRNLFSGPIPSSLLSLLTLVRLDLSYNNFSGPISPDFNNLTRLGTLFLNNNNLTGSIPNLNLPNLAQFNVSFNHLTGPVPSSLTSRPASAFLGNSLCGGPLLSCNNGTTSESGSKSKALSGGAIAGIVIGCVVGLLMILVVLFFICCRRKNVDKKSGFEGVGRAKQREVGQIAGDKSGEDTTESMSAVQKSAGGMGSSGRSGGNGKSLVFFGKEGRMFDLEDLLRASAEVLGKGTFGTAYKAVLEMGLVVAVKRLKEVAVPEKEFREKVEVVGRMEHENLVSLRAYYYSRDEKLLVYDYMPMGSLSALLHGNRSGRTPLNWETRSAIALGASRGIAYLHSQGPSLSHGNIKSSNILLTKSYEPRVSDFGLAQLVGPNTSTPNRVAGYRAPEVTDTRKVSQKSDVYSFGVLLLELMTGKAPTHALLNEEGVDLPRWVQSVVREEWTVEVFDPELLRYQSFEEEMVQLLQLGIDCVAQYPDNRPSMAEVHSRIEEICQSGLQSNQDTLDDIVNDGDEPHHQQDISPDSGAPHSSAAD